MSGKHARTAGKAWVAFTCFRSRVNWKRSSCTGRLCQADLLFCAHAQRHLPLHALREGAPVVVVLPVVVPTGQAVQSRVGLAKVPP